MYLYFIVDLDFQRYELIGKSDKPFSLLRGVGA